MHFKNRKLNASLTAVNIHLIAVSIRASNMRIEYLAITVSGDLYKTISILETIASIRQSQLPN